MHARVGRCGGSRQRNTLIPSPLCQPRPQCPLVQDPLTELQPCPVNYCTVHSASLFTGTRSDLLNSLALAVDLRQLAGKDGPSRDQCLSLPLRDQCPVPSHLSVSLALSMKVNRLGVSCSVPPFSHFGSQHEGQQVRCVLFCHISLSLCPQH